MTIYRGTVLDTPESPFTGGGAARRGRRRDRGDRRRDHRPGPVRRVRAAHPDAEVVDLTGGVVLPGLVDTHVHFPQVRVIGALGHAAAGLAGPLRAAGGGPDGRRRLRARGGRRVRRRADRGPAPPPRWSSGRTSRPRWTCLFERAAAGGLRVTRGLVVSDRLLRAELLTTPEQAHADGLALAGRWHGKDRLRYAVTPRFSLSTSARDAGVLRGAAAATSTARCSPRTSTRTPRRSTTVRGLFPECDSYVDTYGRYGLLGRRSVLAHNVHPTDAELDLLAAAGASVAHCPSSNSALGSGLFPLRRHVEHGVRVALGTDVGAGTGFSLLRGGPAGLLHAAAARGRRAAADRGAHAVPGHRGRRRSAGDGRRGR